ncbi:hypothetical protein C8R45DRAFT_1212031 [Mycena sanguinolenta]|nr:hypothetical protein C8R45DRAFT_1212031 [Mycena sanguinolenta]
MQKDSPSLECMETAKSTLPGSPPPASGVHLKVTAWRLLNTTLLMGFGVYKYYRPTLGDPTSDWIICIGWAVIAYWGTYVEAEAPTLAPWLFIRDIYQPTRLVLAEVHTIAWFIWAPVSANMWAMPFNLKNAHQTADTYQLWLYYFLALVAPFQFWTRVGDSVIITWMHRRWMPPQFNPSDGKFSFVFLLSQFIAGFVDVGQLVYHLHRFTRGSDPAPSVTYLSILTMSISLVLPLAICGGYLALRQRS